MRKDDILEVDGYNVKALRCEDIDLWFKLVAQGKKIQNSTNPLYQIHWSYNGYARKKFRYRLIEADIMFKGIKKINLSLYHLFFAIRPIVVGIMPKKILYHLHKKRFEL